jgi:hypothetical protein
MRNGQIERITKSDQVAEPSPAVLVVQAILPPLNFQIRSVYQWHNSNTSAT